MIYIFLNSNNKTVDLDQYLANLSTEQLPMQEIRVVCDPTGSGGLTVNLPRCSNYPSGNMKIMVSDATGQASAPDAIVINAAPSAPPLLGDSINGGTGVSIDTKNSTVMIEMVYPSALNFGANAGGAWSATWNGK